MHDVNYSCLQRCSVDANTNKLIGMKSYDCHVFTKCLVPTMLSSLPDHKLNPLTELSKFFKDICVSTLKADNLIKLDQKV